MVISEVVGENRKSKIEHDEDSNEITSRYIVVFSLNQQKAIAATFSP